MAALLVVDVQNDFCPSGSLPVAGGDRVVAVLNKYIGIFRGAGLPVYFTRDWHPPVTVHFIGYGGSWPPHCVQGTRGAEFHPGLDVPADALVASKGQDPGEDSYSGFDGRLPNGEGLEAALRAGRIERLYIGGLATDYCVRQTALDGLSMGFEVIVLKDAVRGVDVTPGDSERAMAEMEARGARFMTLGDIDFGRD